MATNQHSPFRMQVALRKKKPAKQQHSQIPTLLELGAQRTLVEAGRKEKNKLAPFHWPRR